MTLDEARQNIGSAVIYRPRNSLPDYGVITSVNERWVFVRYAQSGPGLATQPKDLDLVHGKGA